MVEETYLKTALLDLAVEPPEELTPEQEIGRDELRRKLDLAHRAGLDAEARRMHLAALGLTPLDPKEYTEVWCQWLPTCYCDCQPPLLYWARRRTWSSCEYERIPFDTLEFIAKVREQNLFDYLEIRTPERMADPALFGWIRNEVYLLRRWSESAEQLLTRDQIAAGTAAIAREFRLSRNKDFLFVLSICAGMAAAVLFAVAIRVEASANVARTGLVCAAGSWLLLYLGRKCAKRMQALRAQFAYAFRR